MIYAVIVDIWGCMGVLTFIADTGGGNRVELWPEACIEQWFDGSWHKYESEMLPTGTVIKYFPGCHGKPFAWMPVSFPDQGFGRPDYL